MLVIDILFSNSATIALFTNMLSVCFNQDQETTVYQDESKLKGLQTSVQKIAALSIMVHIIVLISFLFPHEQKGSDSYWSFEEEINRLSETPNFIGAWIWIITLSACISLYIGANKKRRALLVPFMLLVGILQAYFTFNIVMAIVTLVASSNWSLFLTLIFPVALAIVSFKIHRTTKNLFIELGRQPSHIQTNVSYNPGNEQLYSGVYQSGIVGQVRPNEHIVGNGRNREDSGFHANLPTPNHCDQNLRSGPALSSGDSPPAYCETQDSNICINIEAPPTYDDAMQQLKI